MDTLFDFFNSQGKDSIASEVVLIVACILVAGIVGLFIIEKAGSIKIRKLFTAYSIIFIGLVPLVIGITLAARTIHLYAGGEETNGTVVDLYYNKPIKPLAGTGTKQVRRSSSYRKKRFALVKFKSGSETVITNIRINLQTPVSKGAPVKIIYLPDDPSRAVIRGEFVIDTVAIPFILIAAGTMFLGIGIGAWGKQLKEGRTKKIMNDVALVLIVASIASTAIGIPVFYVYKVVLYMHG